MNLIKKGIICLLALTSAFTFAACKKKKGKATEAVRPSDEGANPADYITPEVEGNLIKNGCFNGGEVETASSGDQLMKVSGGEYWLYGIGGYGKMRVTNKNELEISVLNNQTKAEHCIQFAYDGFKIYEQNKYTLEFDAYATYDRHLEVRIQMNGAPYTNYMIAGGVSESETIVTMGKEKKHYKFEFTSQVQDLAPRLVLNCGWFEGDEHYPENNTQFDKETGVIAFVPWQYIYFDNIVLKCDYDAGIRKDPLNRPLITLNQVGFKASASYIKQAVFRKGKDIDLDTEYQIIDVNNDQVVYTGTVTAIEGKNESSNEIVGIADFSDFVTPGKYKIVGNNSKNLLDEKGKSLGTSYEFTIANDVYNDMLNDTLMMLYRQRCGVVQGEDENDKFAHSACHDRDAIVYETGGTIDVRGGWHDAGDYGKYVVAGAQAVADLLLTYDRYGVLPISYDSWVTGTDPDIPDLLEEAMWELDWMLNMQRADGQVYHKVTTLLFPETKVSATSDTATLYVCPPSYAATADFAAVMAKAAYLLKDENIALDKAATYEAAAKKAYAALESMEMESFKNPDDLTKGQVKTGEYPDSELFDELSWASIELYALTGETKYLTVFMDNYTKTPELGLGWANVNGFAVETYLGYFLAHEADDDNYSATSYAAVLKVLTDSVDVLLDNIQKDVYNITIGKTTVDGKEIYQFEWGSNLTIANNAMLIDFAGLYGDMDVYGLKSLQSIQKQVNYLFGQNANCYCFVTGYGTLSPTNPHHRPSIIAEEAMPGMLVGGPDSNFAENGGDNIATNNCEDNAPALCYIDHNNSWSTNEVTIYWNAPLTYILACVILGF